MGGACALVALGAFVAPAHAGRLRCQIAVARAAARALAAAARDAEPAAKSGALVLRACGGQDPPSIGWTAATCPGLSGSCNDAIADIGDVLDCLRCVGETAARELLDVGPDPRASPGAARCAAAARRAAEHQARALARCWVSRLRGAEDDACPDGRASRALARAVSRLTERVCRSCGGPDRRCGGGDDPAIATLGVATECPPLPVPDGTSCAAPIESVSDLAACLACVVGRDAACGTRLGVPAVASYPVACNPPRGTCSPGEMCARDDDCPLGYTCRDNGVPTTRYCVGSPCATDAECLGGGVCRQYCTREGFTITCGARRCQCPGFGCAGPEEICFDEGSLACRKLCLQDSDCIAPFGFVCVNPGFGFGVCIGNEPCL